MATRAQLHAVQASCWLTRHDPWVNLLRSTMAGFSSAVGGADAVDVMADIPWELKCPKVRDRLQMLT